MPRITHTANSTTTSPNPAPSKLKRTQQMLPNIDTTHTHTGKFKRGTARPQQNAPQSHQTAHRQAQAWNHESAAHAPEHGPNSQHRQSRSEKSNKRATTSPNRVPASSSAELPHRSSKTTNLRASELQHAAAIPQQQAPLNITISSPNLEVPVTSRAEPKFCSRFTPKHNRSAYQQKLKHRTSILD